MKKLMLNQKSAMDYLSIKEYIDNLKTYNNKFTIIPSSIYTQMFVESGFEVGIQNIAESNEKNQTGEITAHQAKSIGAKTVIIGHSERRIHQKETKTVLINKFNEAINNKLNIIYCVGENLVDYKLKETNNVILKELDEVLSNVKIDKTINLYIAYEPIWAIGSGETPENYEISSVSKLIKSYLDDKNIEASVLYGGSVNESNINDLLKVENVDGFLVGGASNDYKKVIKICETLMNMTN